MVRRAPTSPAYQIFCIRLVLCRKYDLQDGFHVPPSSRIAFSTSNNFWFVCWCNVRTLTFGSSLIQYWFVILRTVYLYS